MKILPEIYISLDKKEAIIVRKLFASESVAAGRGASTLGGTVQGATFGGTKIWNLKFYTPNLFTVHTNAIVVTIRISVGHLIAGVGAATKTFAPGGKHPRTATALNPVLKRILRQCKIGHISTVFHLGGGLRCPSVLMYTKFDTSTDTLLWLKKCCCFCVESLLISDTVPVVHVCALT